MKEFCVHVDVTMSGYVYVNANNEEEARKKVQNKNFTGADLTNFYPLGTDIIDVEEEL